MVDRQRLKVGVALMLAGLAACGGSETLKPVELVRAAPVTTPDWPTPWPGPALPPGSLNSVNFQPAVQLRVDQLGWHVAEDRPERLMLLFDPDEPAVHDDRFVLFGPRPERVVPDTFAFNGDPENASEPTPPDLLAWLAMRPQLQVTRLAPLTLSGSPAERARIEVKRLPSDANYYGCPTRCVIAYLGPDGQAHAFFEGATYEMILPSNTSKGSQTYVLVGAPATEFDAFRPEAESVLRAVVFP